MLWVLYGHYTFFTFSVQRSTLDVKRRQDLTSKVDPRTEMAKEAYVSAHTSSMSLQVI